MPDSLMINALIVIAFTAFFAWRGYENGVIRTVQRLFSTLSGYAACYFLNTALAALLGDWFGWHGIIAFLAAGVLLFVAASLAMQWSLETLITWFENRDIEPARPAGLVIGALLGLLFGLMTVWAVNVIRDAVVLRQNGPAAFQDRHNDAVRQVAGDMVGGAVGLAIENKTGDDKLMPTIAGRLISDPVGVTQQLVTVSRRSEIKTFFSDPLAQQLMAENRFAEIQQHPAFRDIMKVPESREILGLLGATVKNGKQFPDDERSARLLADLWQKATRLRDDPRYQALSTKPEFQQLLANPSPAALLANPAVEELASIVFSGAPTTGVSPGGSGTALQSINAPRWETVQPPWAPAVTDTTALVPDAPGQPVSSPLIYRWTDEQGRVHYSENKPTGDYEVQATPAQ